VLHRQRGTAIVETKKGILVVSGHGRIFTLPGGAANHKESRFQAAIRELQEETRLVAKCAFVLFRHVGKVHRSYSGRYFRDYHTVVYIEADGIPHPKHEIKYVAYYTPRAGAEISNTTREIIERYYEYKKVECLDDSK